MIPTDRDISEYTLRRTRKGTPISRMCMFAPATIVTDFYSRGAAAAASGYTIPDDVTENNVGKLYTSAAGGWYYCSGILRGGGR